MNVWVSKVMTALNAKGIRAVRAYPADGMPDMTGPVAAVRLYSAEQEATAVLISILVPSALGGAVCEDTAQTAIPTLEALGAQWEQGTCEYDADSDTFCAKLLAIFIVEQEEEEEEEEEEEVPEVVQTITVTMAGTALGNARSFAAWRETDANVIVLEEMPWHFRLEEFFEPGVKEETAPTTPFVLKVTQQGHTETYNGCTWIGQRREFHPDGIRHIREGTAVNRTITV